jgi:hypothetical protein
VYDFAALIIVGVVLIPFPVVPGWPLIIPGLLLVGFELGHLQGFARRLEARWPLLRRVTEPLHRYAERKQSAAPPPSPSE